MNEITGLMNASVLLKARQNSFTSTRLKSRTNITGACTSYTRQAR